MSRMTPCQVRAPLGSVKKRPRSCNQRIDPSFATTRYSYSVSAPAVFAASVSRSTLPRSSGCSMLLIIGMNYLKPKVRRGDPFLDAVTEHRFYIGADKVDSLCSCIGLAPCFPHDTRHRSDDVMEALSLALNLCGKLCSLFFCLF